jgi:hypothetical protein
MYVEVDSTFYQQQLAVITRQIRLIMEMADDVMMRLDEMQMELDDTSFLDKFNQKVGLDTVDCICDCPDCQHDRSYRMD